MQKLDSREVVMVHPFFRPISWLWAVAGGWPGYVAVMGCWVLAAAHFAQFVVAMVYGIPFACVVYIDNPYMHLGSALGFLFLGWVLARGWRSTLRVWAVLLGKGGLLLFSLLLSVVVAEVGLRVFLIAKQEHNSLERFKTLSKEGRDLHVHSEHPMAHIIEPSEDPGQVYQLKPGLDREFGHRVLRPNSRGWRDDREYEESKPAGCIRIVGIGDSGMFARRF